MGNQNRGLFDQGHFFEQFWKMILLAGQMTPNLLTKIIVVFSNNKMISYLDQWWRWLVCYPQRWSGSMSLTPVFVRSSWTYLVVACWQYLADLHHHLLSFLGCWQEGFSNSEKALHLEERSKKAVVATELVFFLQLFWLFPKTKKVVYCIIVSSESKSPPNTI